MSIKTQLVQDIKGRNNKEAAEVILDLLQKYNDLIDILEANKEDISEVDFESLKLKLD
jgi:predicted CopG family antitoxin